MNRRKIRRMMWKKRQRIKRETPDISNEDLQDIVMDEMEDELSGQADWSSILDIILELLEKYCPND